MEQEIGEQPEVLRRIIADRRGRISWAASEIRKRDPMMVVLVARGSSDHAALYLKYLIEIEVGLPVGLYSPSSTTVYGANPFTSGMLVIGISQSGSSPDIVTTLDAARTKGALTLAVTNVESCDLAGTAEMHLDLTAGPEISVAATKSYTAELCLLRELVRAWRGGASDAGGVPDAAAEAIEDRAGIRETADLLSSVPQLLITGRGFAYPTAREGALKLMETCYLPTLSFSAADLLHGPLALLGSDLTVLALTPNGATSVEMGELVNRIAATGSRLITLGPVAYQAASMTIRTRHELPENLAPIVDVISLQLLALELARLRGINPDKPRALSKVTKTL